MTKKLEIIVPYRNRPEHLAEFAPVLSDFLKAEKIPFHISIVNQADDLLFNRAKLLNVGFLETCGSSDYTCFHDVDMLPKKKGADYSYTKTARQVHSPTEYSMGGISLANNKIIKQVNGWSNAYWGWGGEDRNFCHRLKNHGIKLEESQGFRKWAWGKEHFRELEGHHDAARKEHKKKQHRITKKLKVMPELNDSDGLSDCLYKIIDVEKHDLYDIINVDLSE